MPVSGDTARFSNAQPSSVGNYTVTGANYNWNFSTIIPTGQAIRKFQPSTTTPYFFYFFLQTEVVKNKRNKELL